MEEPLKFILIPMGSAGDVHPIIWLARLLQARGHEVRLIVQAPAEEPARRSGVPYDAVGDKEELEAILHHPDLWHPRRAFRLIAEKMPVYAEEMIPIIRSHIEPGRTVMIAGSLAFAARVIAEKWDVPLLSAHLQPSLMMSAEDPSVMMAKGEWLPKLPRWLRRMFFGLAHREVDRVMRKPVQRLRDHMGLPGPAPRGIMREWWHGPDGVLCLFPEWYAPKAGDWPRQAVTTRFPLYDESAVMKLDPELEAFLAGGEPPIVATPGSANVQAGRFLKEAAEACVRLKRRAILLTRYPEQSPANMPATIRTFQYLPFGQVFPRSAAVIHHGGVGTTAQCLAAGVPQLIMPMAHDQPDNAARIKKLGVGDYLYPGKFKGPRIAERLQLLVASDAVKSACGQVRERMRQQMSEDEMGELIERLSRSALSRPARRNQAVPV